jgi:hypothetical protein
MEDMAFMEGDTLDDEHLAPDQREYREMSVVGSA